MNAVIQYKETLHEAPNVSLSNQVLREVRGTQSDICSTVIFRCLYSEPVTRRSGPETTSKPDSDVGDGQTSQ